MVLHGTDTMAYTSSALSFLLPGFGKPVVVTGSQIPITRIRSDGRQNFIGALQVAAQSNVDEVTLLFGEVLLRGNRATKMDASASMRSTHHGFRHSRTSASTSWCTELSGHPTRVRASPPGALATSLPCGCFQVSRRPSWATSADRRCRDW